MRSDPSHASGFAVHLGAASVAFAAAMGAAAITAAAHTRTPGPHPASTTQLAPGSASGFRPGQVLVRFRPSAGRAVRSAALARVGGVPGPTAGSTRADGIAGQYSLPGLHPGSYSVRAKKKGCQSLTKPATVKANTAANLNFALTCS